MTARKAPEDLLFRIEKEYIETINSSRKEITMKKKPAKKAAKKTVAKAAKKKMK